MSAYDFKLDSMSQIDNNIEQAQQNKINDARKNAAMNALTNIYGPIAGDPEDALKMQSYGQNNALNPLLVQKQLLENSGASLANQKASTELPFVAPKAQADINETNARTGLYGAQTATDAAGLPFIPAEKQAAIAGTQANTADTQAQTQTRNFQLGLAQANANRAAVAGVVTALSNTVTSGGDVGAAFDKYAPIISDFTGGDPGKLTQLRQRLVKDPQNTINDLTAAMMAGQTMLPGNGKLGAGMSPLQQRAQQISAMQVIAERTKAVPNTISQAMALVPQMSSSAIIRKAKERVPGTAEYQFDQLVQSIKSNLSLDDLRSLRTSGLSLGRTNIAEFTASANAFGNVDLGQDPRTIATTLQRLGGTYGQINSNLQADIARMHVGIPGATPPAAPGQQQSNRSNMPESLATAFIKKNFPGAQITSTYRSPAQNKAIGGADGSMHTQGNGMAVDTVLPKGVTPAQFKAKIQASGLPVTEFLVEKAGDPHSTGDHVHWGWGQKAAAKTASVDDLLNKYGAR